MTETTEPYEEIHSPKHYQLPDGLEVIDLIEDLPFNVASALKYLFRAGKKPGASSQTDLEKALYYVEREVIRLRRQGAILRVRAISWGTSQGGLCLPRKPG